MAELERVSFKIAKVLKEAGYPQIGNMNYAAVDGATVMNKMSTTIPIGKLIDSNDYLGYVASSFISAPTYMEVWLWLWREKRISIMISQNHNDEWEADVMYGKKYITAKDPEGAIIAAIEYLVTNDLIK